MNKKEYLTNFKVMFTMFICLVLLILLFLSSNIVHALSVSMWGTELNNKIDNLTSSSNYTYVDYNSDTIKEFIFNRSNEQFFDNSLTQAEFYNQFNYVVMGYSQTTIRVFVQNYNLAMDYQGLNAIEGNDTIFFFANLTAFGGVGVYSQLQAGVNAIYSYYIDINYNTLSYTFSDNNPLTDLNFYLLGKDYKGGDYGNYGSQTIDINMQLFDSYNGNFSWIETWNELDNTNALWRQASGEPSYSNGTFYNSIIEFPVLEFVSSGTSEEETPGDNENNDYSDILGTIENWLSKIEGNTSSSKGFLESIGETLGKIGESIGDGLNDIINGISDTLDNIFNFLSNILEEILDAINNILDFFKESWDTSPLETLKDKFVVEDFGEDNFFMILSDYLGRVKDNSTTCESISISLPFVNSNLNLPCMTDIYNKISPNFLNFYQIITTAIISFGIVLNIFDTIAIVIDPSIDLWALSRDNKDIIKVNSKTGEVVD